MAIVTIVGMISGGAIILAALVIALRQNAFPRNASVFLGIGAFLIVGSQWASFKVTTSGIEVLRTRVEKTEDAVATTANAVEVTQTQVANISNVLEEKRVLSPQINRDILRTLANAPPHRIGSRSVSVPAVRTNRPRSGADTARR